MSFNWVTEPALMRSIPGRNLGYLKVWTNFQKQQLSRAAGSRAALFIQS